jgi:basic amino acid/polyamine antiporter, APA family
MAFGTYLQTVVPSLPPLALSLLLVWITTAVHVLGIRTGANFQNWSTVTKLVLIFGLILGGLLVSPGQPLDFSVGPEGLRELMSAPFAVSLVYVMYAYSGWNAASYITEEVVEPEKNVPRAMAFGTVIVTVVYLTLNYIFLRTTPKAILAGQLQVGVLAGESIFGSFGAKIVSILIGFGLVATVGAMAWIGPRVTRAMAEDFPKLRFLRQSTRNGTPHVATLLQVAVVTGLILSATFQTILIYVQFSLLLSSFLTVLGLIVLRVKRPALQRPYRVWGYPMTPLVFLAVTLHMMIYTAREKPVESGCGLLTVCCGFAVYFVCRGAPRKPGAVP